MLSRKYCVEIVPKLIKNGIPLIHHPMYSAPQLPQGHRFPMGVFQCNHDYLLKEGVVYPQNVFYPHGLPSEDQLLLVHEWDYVYDFLHDRLSKEKIRRIGFGEVTRTPVLVERTLAEVAGTMLTAEMALEYGIACNTAGGTHHAFPAYGSGFCLINDIGIAAKQLIQDKKVSKIMVVDLDVHQGDGTAAIFEEDPSVFTLSIHCQSNFPARKQKSNLDVGLPDNMEDAQYLRKLSEVLPDVLLLLLLLVTLPSEFSPDLVLYDAGVDPHINDRLGRLALTDDGLFRRDMMVLDTCLGSGIPVAGLVGGGYDDDLQILSARHCLLHRAAKTIWESYNIQLGPRISLNKQIEQ